MKRQSKTFPFRCLLMRREAQFGMQHPMLPGAWGEQPHIKSRRISLLYALYWRRGAWEWVLDMGEVGAEDGRHWGWNMGEVDVLYRRE